MAYLTLVKPKLFYGTPAWHPWSKANIRKIARTQNKALHFIYGRHVPPPQNMKMLSVPAQLVYNDLLLFKKSLCGLTDYNAMARIIVGRVHRSDDPQHPRLQQPPARTGLGTQPDAERKESAVFSVFGDELRAPTDNYTVYGCCTRKCRCLGERRDLCSDPRMDNYGMYNWTMHAASSFWSQG
ncbi:Hypothetical predicted protein [Cloeon dipterum]|uniref:Uncharacterized protein n=1 Tax=Cloeon dipterum TaxID=197152 RepID=A0A8S1DLN9_9INSE|nr:Hypothetical predicted protein [Cloeon dipterum]